MGGAIEVEYDQAGGFNFFGDPTTPERNAANNGKFQVFAKNSSIYWNANVSGGRANQIGGVIRDRWGQLNWENGALGYPTTRETATPSKPGRYNHFQGGSIYWSSTTGARNIWGAIRNKWSSMGWENSPLGFPTSNEFTAGGSGGWGQHFQGGSIYTSAAGTFAVWGEIKETWEATGWENGTYGYPVSDEFDFENGKRQNFQRGYITWRPEGIDPPDWTEDVISELECGNCSDDAWLTSPEPQYLQSNPDLFDIAGPPEFAPGGCTAAMNRMRSSRAPATQREWCIGDQEWTKSQPPRQEPAAVPTPSTAERPANPGGGRTTDSQTPSPAPTSSAPPAAAPVETTLPQAAAITPTPPAAAEGQRQPSDIALAYPSWCNNLWRGGRRMQCQRSQSTIYYLVDPNGRSHGTITGTLGESVVTTWNKLEWTVEQSFSVSATTGEGQLATMTANMSCVKTGCAQVSGNNFASKLAAPGVTLSVNMTYRLAPPAGGTTENQARVTTTVNSQSGTGGASDGKPVIRCDSAPDLRNTSGCAVRDAVPIMGYNTYSNLSGFNRHVGLAQQSGLPGAPPASPYQYGAPLHRLTDQVQIRKNRAASCGQVTGPRVNQLSCDEYPFASSDEGARKPGHARTFDLCGVIDTDFTPWGQGDPQSTSGHSVCLISAKENSRAGSLLTWFYAKNRIRTGDPFYVRVK